MENIGVWEWEEKGPQFLCFVLPSSMPADTTCPSLSPKAFPESPYSGPSSLTSIPDSLILLPFTSWSSESTLFFNIYYYFLFYLFFALGSHRPLMEPWLASSISNPLSPPFHWWLLLHFSPFSYVSDPVFAMISSSVSLPVVPLSCHCPLQDQRKTLWWVQKLNYTSTVEGQLFKWKTAGHCLSNSESSQALEEASEDHPVVWLPF